MNKYIDRDGVLNELADMIKELIPEVEGENVSSECKARYAALDAAYDTVAAWPLADTGPKFGKWVKVRGDYMSPGGCPLFRCECGGSEHPYGTEYRKRKMICDKCGRINCYPWERMIEEESEEDD